VASTPLYPAEWESDVVLADGGTVLLRPLRPDDDDRLRTLYEQLSDESLYLRFFSAIPAPTATTLERRMPLDYRDHMILAAMLGDAMVAIARYDRLAGQDSTAEVAFTVRDDQHGRGLATVMLEHLAVIGRTNGVRRFVASVLPANRRMIGVFRDAGFEVSQHFGDGAIEVVLDIEPTPRSLAAVEGRERLAEGRSMARLLAPRTIAVVGARRREGTLGHQVLRNLLDGDFAGKIFPVNPAAATVAGLPAHPSLRAVPDAVDLVVVAVPASAVAGVVDDAASAGARGLVIVSAGFSELGEEGRQAEREVVRRARANGMRVIGPGSLGVVQTHPDVRMNALVAPFSPAAGPVAILTQSGALGLPLMARLGELGLGVSTFVSVGNKADVSGNDLLQHWEDDPATSAIVLYLETFGNPRKFARLARRIARAKPIVAVKSARSRPGARTSAAARHAGERLDVRDSTVEALFRQAGVIRVDTLEQLLDTTRVLVQQPLPAGRRVAVLANAAGTAVLTADACDAAGLDVVRLGHATQAALRPLAPPGAHVRNPVDLGTSARAEEFAAALDAVLEDGGVDAAIVTYLAPFAEETDAIAAALARDRPHRKPVVACVLGRAGTPAALRHGTGTVPSFAFPEGAALALARAAERAEWLARPTGQVPDLAVDVEQARALTAAALSGGGESARMPPADARALLDCFGIPSLPSRHVHSATDAAEAARAIGLPVAVRAVAPALAHPNDAGAVRLDVATAAEAAAAYDAVVDAATGRRDVLGSPITVDGALVQPMIERGVATIAGIVTDESFGPVVGFAVSGIAADLLGDVAVHIVPVTDRDAHDIVRGLRASPLLFGYRGRPAVAVDHLAEVLVRLGILADALPEVEAIVLDPLVVGPAQATVADVDVVLREPQLVPEAGFRRLRRA
jgi:acyl-CoA synthetase (NDP forming)/RimJ/RimL family protein N-acetyltransferase